MTSTEPLIGKTVRIDHAHLSDPRNDLATVVAMGHGDGVWLRFPSGAQEWFDTHALTVVDTDASTEQRQDVASTWDVRHSTQENLAAFADIMADALRNNLVPVQDALVPLHHAALELNRRHNNASLQGRGKVRDALAVIEATDDLFDSWTGDMAVDWSAVYRDRARAFGALADHGMWDLVRTVGYSRADVEAALESLALAEGRQRGFDHRPAVAEFLPAGADEIAPPF